MFALWREDSVVRPLDHLLTSPSREHIMTFHHPLEIITLWYRVSGSGDFLLLERSFTG